MAPRKTRAASHLAPAQGDAVPAQGEPIANTLPAVEPGDGRKIEQEHVEATSAAVAPQNGGKTRGKKPALAEKSLNVAEVPAFASGASANASAATEKAGRAKKVVNERAIAAAPKPDTSGPNQQRRLEEELAELSAKLEEVTVQKERSVELLKKSEEEKLKLKQEVVKLQKVKTFVPELDKDVIDALARRSVEATEISALVEPDDAKKEKSKDPRKPKHPMSGYRIWCSENYQQIKSNHPSASFAEISKVMSDVWKNTSEDVKKAYDVKFSEQMAAFKDAMASYEKMILEEKRQEGALQKLQEKRAQEEAMKLLQQYIAHNNELAEVSQEAAGKKKMKDPEKPKAPTNAFLLYCNERRKLMSVENSKRNPAEETKHLADEWNKLEKVKKEKYEKQALKDCERYSSEMEAYKAKKQREEELMRAQKEKKQQEDLKIALSMMRAEESPDEAATIVKRDDGTKGKRSYTGYNLFCSSIRDGIRQAEPGITMGDLNKRLGQAWKDTPDAEKASWNAKAAEANSVHGTWSLSADSDFGI